MRSCAEPEWQVAARRSIGDGLRFRVLKRDRFRCRYCGAHGSEVELQIDHVQPVIAGGSNHPRNLVTSCRRCNLGKLAVPPSWSPCTEFVDADGYPRNYPDWDFDLEPRFLIEQFEQCSLGIYYRLFDAALKGCGGGDMPDEVRAGVRQAWASEARFWRWYCGPQGTGSSVCNESGWHQHYDCGPEPCSISEGQCE